MLEEKGIGRPSTYATILTTIQDREYVVKQEGKFSPTELGFVINDVLVASFADIFDIQYTARMEEELDEIEEGKIAWTEALQEFYGKFEVDLKTAGERMGVIREPEPTDEKCEKCGSPMVIRWGRHGRFMACSAYPECKNTREIAREGATANVEGKAEVEQIEELCENCGRPMTLKRGRFGQFLACTGYPECKTTKKLAASGSGRLSIPDVPLEEKCPQCGKHLVIKHGRFGEFTACSAYPECKHVKKKTIGIACPKPNCKGELVEKKSRRGKVFYGCDQYPNCDFTAWNKPINKPCPQCGAGYLLEKTTKKQGTIHYCNVETCDFKEVVELVETV
jgi:DNA topoisomerase-1